MQLSRLEQVRPPLQARGSGGIRLVGAGFRRASLRPDPSCTRSRVAADAFQAGGLAWAVAAAGSWLSLPAHPGENGGERTPVADRRAPPRRAGQGPGSDQANAGGGSSPLSGGRADFWRVGPTRDSVRRQGRPLGRGPLRAARVAERQPSHLPRNSPFVFPGAGSTSNPSSIPKWDRHGADRIGLSDRRERAVEGAQHLGGPAQLRVFWTDLVFAGTALSAPSASQVAARAGDGFSRSAARSGVDLLRGASASLRA